MENETDIAAAWFDQGFSCAQAIVAAFGDQHGLDTQQALRVAGVGAEGSADWSSTGSTAWQTQLDPEDPKER